MESFVFQILVPILLGFLGGILAIIVRGRLGALNTGTLNGCILDVRPNGTIVPISVEYNPDGQPAGTYLQFDLATQKTPANEPGKRFKLEISGDDRTKKIEIPDGRWTTVHVTRTAATIGHGPDTLTPIDLSSTSTADPRLEPKLGRMQLSFLVDSRRYALELVPVEL